MSNELSLDKALTYCYCLLSRRAYSCGQLKYRLRSKGYDDSVISLVMNKLESLGYVDDWVLARQWVEQRARTKPSGRYRLKMELVRKGVPSDIVEQVLTEYEADYSQLELCLLAAQKYCRCRDFRSPEDMKRRINGFLKRRGFGSYVIALCLQELDINK